MTDFFVNERGMTILPEGVTYYRDGVLYYARLVDEEPVLENSMPTLWSSIVLTYRKKQDIVEAVQLSADNVNEVAEWCGGLQVEEVDYDEGKTKHVGINIPTLEGNKRASEGDFVVKGSRGDFYPVVAHVFTNTFDPA